MEKLTYTQTFFTLDDKNAAQIKTIDLTDKGKFTGELGFAAIATFAVENQPTAEAARVALRAKLQEMITALDS